MTMVVKCRRSFDEISFVKIQDGVLWDKRSVVPRGGESVHGSVPGFPISDKVVLKANLILGGQMCTRGWRIPDMCMVTLCSCHLVALESGL